MNARSQTFELTLKGSQTYDAVSSLFHTILLHRTLGKFEYYEGTNRYKMGSIGYTDVKCDFIDLHYVCCSSSALLGLVNGEILKFSNAIHESENNGYNTGQISLEFFERRPQKWPLYSDCVPWEVWTVRLDLVSVNLDRWGEYREKVGQAISDKIIHITDIMNRHENYIPVVSNRSDLEYVFNTGLPDVQPYLFKFDYSVNGPSSAVSMGSTVRKLLRETFSF
ncbi:autophagy-related protein 101 [Coccinella septempunctata]|uniref:autophagy-related protein 101 n=1 Tax=Coccinella septempunctata TaxID=41139 RepID=UPI001D0665F0|nr:autophagy-related protein 101 [Coccinella septempunctata]